MHRPLKAALLGALTVTFPALVGLAACGSDDAAEAGGGGDGGRDGNGTIQGPDGSIPIKSTCKADTDCNGAAKCRDIGGAKACVASKSCVGKPGSDRSCGGKPGDESSAGTTDCCEARGVPGGTFNQFNRTDFPAKISPFVLDTFEVTAGRFRAWVDATDGNLRASAPAQGAAAHPKIPGSGWRTEWNSFLPETRAGVDTMLSTGCAVGTNLDDFGALTWWTEALDAKVKQGNKNNASVLAENTKDALDRKPLNCVPWHVLFAFCAWDGGRLPTNAEFGYAAAGGSEQRAFPWGNVAANDLVHVANRDDLSLVPIFSAASKYTTALLYDPSKGPNRFPDNYFHTWGNPVGLPRDNAAHIAPVGRKALGNGKWGHADLAGGVHEWMLDVGPVVAGTCNDCANVDFPAKDAFDPNAKENLPEFEHQWFRGGARAIRGGAWDNSYSLATGQSETEIETYTSYPVLRTYRSLGGRCARDL